MKKLLLLCLLAVPLAASAGKIGKIYFVPNNVFIINHNPKKFNLTNSQQEKLRKIHKIESAELLALQKQRIKIIQSYNYQVNSFLNQQQKNLINSIDHNIDAKITKRVLDHVYYGK